MKRTAISGAEDLIRQYAGSCGEVFVQAARDDNWGGVQTHPGLIAAVDGQPAARTATGVPLTQTGWEY